MTASAVLEADDWHTPLPGTFVDAMVQGDASSSQIRTLLGVRLMVPYDHDVYPIYIRDLAAITHQSLSTVRRALGLTAPAIQRISSRTKPASLDLQARRLIAMGRMSDALGGQYAAVLMPWCSNFDAVGYWDDPSREEYVGTKWQRWGMKKRAKDFDDDDDLGHGTPEWADGRRPLHVPASIVRALARSRLGRRDYQVAAITLRALAGRNGFAQLAPQYFLSEEALSGVHPADVRRARRKLIEAGVVRTVRPGRTGDRFGRTPLITWGSGVLPAHVRRTSGA